MKDHHIVSYKTFLIIWAALMVLTVVTVLIAQVDLGYFNVVGALLVASTKAAIVIMFFMHLKYESSFFKLMVFICLLILTIFIGFTFFDIAYR